VKRCGKSAPRVRQRNRHGKPHREQDRIGTATRECSLKGDNTAGRCLARRPGRLLEATCKRCPRGMAVTYRLRKQAVPYKTRLTGRLISQNEGFGAARRTPHQFDDSRSGILRRTRPQICDSAPRNLEIPGSLVQRSPAASGAVSVCGSQRLKAAHHPDSRAASYRLRHRRPAHTSSLRENRTGVS
jgi:hypothetical protein